MNTNVELVVQDLLNQITSLSREKAVYYALATEKMQENEHLRKRIEELEPKKSKKK